MSNENILSAGVAGNSVPEPRTEAEKKLWHALCAHPCSTANELAVKAEIGKSTAGKILARWANDEHAIRTSGGDEGGRRLADSWMAAADVVSDDAAETHEALAPVDEENPDDTFTATNLAESDGLEETRADGPSVGPSVTEAQADSTNDVESHPATALAEGDESHAVVNEEQQVGETQRGDELVTAVNSVERLAPGALRGQVEDFLRGHPGTEFGPVAIAKALGGRSSGAVSNALDRLVAQGVVTRTQDAPKRFVMAAAV